MTDYAWSSYPAYLLAPSKRPVWLRVDRMLGEFGIRRDDVAEELRQRRWAEGTLKERRKPDAENVKLAQRLQQETVITLDRIA